MFNLKPVDHYILRYHINDAAHIQKISCNGSELNKNSLKSAPISNL